jgi:hypothetical protein
LQREYEKVFKDIFGLMGEEKMNLINETVNTANGNKYIILMIPADLVDTIKERLGDEFLWDYDKKTNSLLLMKKPTSYTDFLTGLGKEMWDSVGGSDYIRQERDQWDS